MTSGMGSAAGCGLVLAGLAVEGVLARRWRVGGRPAPLDALAALAFALPAVGLVLMAAVAA